MDPKQLFVFAGAGVSFSAPTSLLTFNHIRDETLIGLRGVRVCQEFCVSAS
jgi:hypothetical protein